MANNKSLEELEISFKETMAKRDKVAAEVEELKKAAAVLDKETEEAAMTGDVGLYLAKKKEKDANAETLYVKSTQLAAIKEELPADEVLSAWENFVADYDKDIEKKMVAYDNLRKKLNDAYMDMVEAQAEALATRERMAKYLGIDSKSNSLNGCPEIIEKTFKMRLMPLRVTSLRYGAMRLSDPDALFCLCNTGLEGPALLASPVATLMHNVLNRHLSR